MSDTRDPQRSNAADKDLTLSAALLAPLNSIFEAQVHAARSFLSFILQMGFKQRHDPKDIEREKNRLQAQNALDEDTKNKLDAMQQLAELRNERDALERLNTRTPAQQQRLQEIHKELSAEGEEEDIYTHSFRYRDSEGDIHTIEVPSLALIPVKPLAVNSAEFEFSMSVNDQYEQYNQMQRSALTDEARPWYFISPKRLRGKISSKESGQKQASISVKVNIESTPIPQGLSNLLVSLTQSSKLKSEDEPNG